MIRAPLFMCVSRGLLCAQLALPPPLCFFLMLH
jgi:hypothetical protein